MEEKAMRYLKMHTCLVKEYFMWQPVTLGSYFIDTISNFSFYLDKEENIFQSFKKLIEPYLRKNNYIFEIADDLIKLYETTYKAVAWFGQYDRHQYRFLLNQGYNYYLSNLAHLIDIMFNYAINTYLEEENATTEDFLEEIKKYFYQYFPSASFEYFKILEKESCVRNFTINGQQLI